MALAAGAAAAEVAASCQPVVTDGDEDIVCNVRTTGGDGLSALSVDIPDARRIDYELNIYSWADHPTAFYYVIETSGVSAAQLQRMTDFMEKAAQPVGRQLIGIASAGERFVEEAETGSSRSALGAAIRTLRSQEPATEPSVVLSSLRQAVRRASEATAERRAVVVLTGGSANLAGERESSLAEAARKAGVALYFISFGESGAGLPDSLQRLGQRTQGGSFDLSGASPEASADLAAKLPGYLQSGYLVRIDATGLPETAHIDFTVRLDDDTMVDAERVTIRRRTEDTLLERSQMFLADNLIALMAAIGLGLGGLLIARSGAFNGQPALPEADRDDGSPAPAPRPRATPGAADPYGGATRIVALGGGEGAGDGPVGWLEAVGGRQEPVALEGQRTMIGRSEKNHIRLLDSSVHRQHAVIEAGTRGRFTIHDLDTRNGVIVNGERCKSRILAHGDVIELGEAKLRFLAHR